MAENTSIDPSTFRKALGNFATGVTIVTARGPDGRDVGVTANSFNSVSIDPPLVLWSLNRNSSSLPAFTEGEGFAVHILAAEQQALSDRFASRADDRFSGLSFERGFGGAPLLPGCSALFQCRLAFRYDGGDHEILVGEVVDIGHSASTPLVYHGGRYGAVTSLTAADNATDYERASELMHLLSRAYHLLFAVEREEFTRRGLSEAGYLILRLLGTRDGLAYDKLEQLAATGGLTINQIEVDSLLDSGEIVRDGAGAFHLSAEGRQTMMELAAVRLSREEDALASFDRSEVLLLKGLLRRLVKKAASTDVRQ